jgi:hypothetical protein
MEVNTLSCKWISSLEKGTYLCLSHWTHSLFQQTDSIILDTIHCMRYSLDTTFWELANRGLQIIRWYYTEKYIWSKNTVFSEVILCSPVEVHQHFRGTYCLHLQDQRVSQARSHQRAGGKKSIGRVSSSGMWQCVVQYNSNEFLEEHTASIFRIKR